VTPFAEERNAYRVLVGKQEGKKILARYRCRIRICCRPIGWESAVELISFRIAKSVRLFVHGDGLSDSSKCRGSVY